MTVRCLETLTAALLVVATVGCSSPHGGEPDARAGDGASAPDGAPGGDVVVEPRDAQLGDAGVGTNACPSVANAPGPVVQLLWPNPSNSGHDAAEGQTVHLYWNDGQPHNVIEVALWEGQAAPLGPVADAMWPDELNSGAKTVNGSFDWNLGSFPCGWRPGLYYLADQDNPHTGITALSYTIAMSSHDYDPRPCSALADPSVYRGRYASYATRAGCTQYEVNNFRTEAHYDYVPAAFGVVQGDLVLVRWTGLHNAVQVHDQSLDEPVGGGGIFSGPRSNCVGGPNFGCANGGLDLGEYLIDTTDYRPGVVHMSDQCAYGCAHCPYACDNVTNDMMFYGTPFQFMVSRPHRPTAPVAGACCAIDHTKGQACRVVDLYNDNEGTQFDTGLGGGITVNRGDLVRFRWAGGVRIVQTTATTTMTGVASQNALAGGAAMAHAVECVPGPHWTCANGTTDSAQFVFDVDAAYSAHHYQSFSYGGDFFDFYAFADNSTDTYHTTQDSAVLLPVGQTTPYADNPPCP